MQWFLKEQVEEVASMTTLLDVVDRAGDNLFHLEDFLAREAVGEPGTHWTALAGLPGGAALSSTSCRRLPRHRRRRTSRR